MKLHSLLRRLGVLDSYNDFIKNHKTIEDIVNRCNSGEVLLYIASSISIEYKFLAKARIQCAKTIVHLMNNDKGLLDAIDVAERFVNGNASYEDFIKAKRDSYLAAMDENNLPSDDAALAVHSAIDDLNVPIVCAAPAFYATQAAHDRNGKEFGIEIERKCYNICKELLGDLIVEKVNLMLKNGY